MSEGHLNVPVKKQKKQTTARRHSLYRTPYGDGDDDDEDTVNNELIQYRSMEQRLMESLKIAEPMALGINARILSAFRANLLRVPIMAFMTTRAGGVQFVQDFKRLTARHEIELLGKPVPISKKHLSVDLFNYEVEFGRVLGVALYPASLDPPLTTIIMRQAIGLTPKVPDIFPLITLDDEASHHHHHHHHQDTQTTQKTTINTTTTTTTTVVTQISSSNTNTGQSTSYDELGFFDRIYLNYTRVREIGEYYVIYVDLGLSKPAVVGKHTSSSTSL